MVTLFITILAINVVAGGRLLAGLFGKMLEPALLLDALDLVVAMLTAEIEDLDPPAEPDPLDRQARYTYEIAVGVYADIRAAQIPAGLARTAIETSIGRMRAIEEQFTAAVAAGGTPIS
jgi:hypothetical protein